MKILPLTLALLFAAFLNGTAQQMAANDTVETITAISNVKAAPIPFNELVFSQAQYQGGPRAMAQYLSENLKYPRWAAKNNIEGTVLVQCTIDVNGNVGNVVLKQPLGRGFDKEAVRVIKEMPSWIPAIQASRNVSQKVIIPIEFSLAPF